MTPSEARLWSAISHRQLGVRFRRQVVVGNRFIVDFLAPSRRLVIEVDGGYHCRRSAVDAQRDAKLKSLGYRVLRLEARFVLSKLPLALARITEALEHSPAVCRELMR